MSCDRSVHLRKKFLNNNASVLFVEPGQLAFTPAGSQIYITKYESVPKTQLPGIFAALHIPLGNKLSEVCPHFVKAAITSHNVAFLGQKTGPLWTTCREFFDIAF